MPANVWENVDTTPPLPPRARLTPRPRLWVLVCVHSIQALHTGYISCIRVWPRKTAGRQHAPKARARKNNNKKKKNNPMSPAQLEINVTSPPEDNVCLLGKLCESQSSSSRKVSGGVRLYVGVFSADCTPEMSSRSLQWSQASNLCISSDFFSLSLTHIRPPPPLLLSICFSLSLSLQG